MFNNFVSIYNSGLFDDKICEFSTNSQFASYNYEVVNFQPPCGKQYDMFFTSVKVKTVYSRYTDQKKMTHLRISRGIP